MDDLFSPPGGGNQRDAAFAAMLTATVQQAIKPLIDRIDHLENKLDDKYYSKETVDNRLAPIERSLFNQSQRLWLTVGGICGVVAMALNLAQHVSVK